MLTMIKWDELFGFTFFLQFLNSYDYYYYCYQCVGVIYVSVPGIACRVGAETTLSVGFLLLRC